MLTYEITISGDALQNEAILDFHRGEMDRAAKERMLSARIASELFLPAPETGFWILKRSYTTGRN